MENASKALLMAGSILIGILILALMVTLFSSSSTLSKSYEKTKKAETIQQFNANFTKYLGQNLTIHDVVTITNFAKQEGVSVVGKDYTQIKEEIETYTKDYIKTYKLTVNAYSEEGYINSISFIEN